MNIVEDVKKKINEFNEISINSLSDLENLKIEYLGKKGLFNKYNAFLKELDNDNKKELGMILNKFKNIVSEKLADVKEKLELEELNNKLDKESIDISLPGDNIHVGAANLLEQVVEELENIFISFGYDVVEGPEVEKDLYNFELLNLPIGHPARDAQDTFYIDGNTWLLRSQTSPVQVRTMLSNINKDYIRIVCPGKTYRRDNDDATHSHQFTQMEGLLVGKGVSLAHLKSTLNIMANKLFGETNVRFRPSFYPFTEPSVEYDVECFNCKGKGCNICKNTGWITIGGAGMVHPNVLKNCGYDTNIYNGFAFGMGIERIAMLKYGITDVRTFYNNDLRILRKFEKRGESHEN